MECNDCVKLGTICHSDKKTPSELCFKPFTYRVSVNPAVEKGLGNSIKFDAADKEQAIAIKESIADMLLFLQDKLKVMPDYSNIIYVERKSAHENWEDIEQDEY